MEHGTGPSFEDFAGRWRLERDIDDHLGGPALRFEGEARFTPNAAGLDYFETGLLWGAPSGPLRATRRYVWTRAGQDIAVAFDDGRPFHRFDPAGVARATHWCAPDTYRVAYDFSGWPAWACQWDVQGPRKSYVMQSRYTPA